MLWRGVAVLVAERLYQPNARSLSGEYFTSVIISANLPRRPTGGRRRLTAQ